MKKRLFVRAYRQALVLLAVTQTAVFAQNSGISKGSTAITSAAADLKGYFEPVTTLIYMIAAIVGLVGGFRIFAKWQNGDQDVQKSAMGWVGSILFLLAIAFLLQTVFFP